MSRRVFLPPLFLAVTFLAVSCTDADPPSEPARPDVTAPAWSIHTAGPAPYALAPDARTRWDAPWWDMSDAELADSIAAHGGRAYIGFKEPGTLGGVDEWGRVLVTHAAAIEGKRAMRALGLAFEYESILAPTVVALIPRTLVSVIRRHPLVDYLEPDGRVHFESQDTTWNVWQVNAPQSWSSSTGSGVMLLVIDSGSPTTHVDLNPYVIQACDGSNGLDQHGHGTHVAGIAAATNNSIGVIGVSHGVQLWSSRTQQFTTQQVHCAVQFARVNGVDVINMSFATTESIALTDMIKGAYADGIFIAKSAGNTDGGAVTYPANLFETVAVTALDINNNRASFAAVGPSVELAAPGVNITSTCLGGLTCPNSGTSMAAPHVAAAAAILKAYNPSWTNTDIRTRLQRTASNWPNRNELTGYGLIDIRAALDWQPSPPPPPPAVSIAGPPSIRPGADCSWQAVVSGGAPPYSYSWWGQVQPGSGSGQYYTGRKDPSQFGSTFRLYVSVTDSNYQVDTASLLVTEQAGAPMCILSVP